MAERYYVTCTDANGRTVDTLEDVVKEVIYESRSKSPYNPFVTKILKHKKIKGYCVYDGCDCGERLVERQKVSAGIRRYFFIADSYSVADTIASIAEDYDMNCTINLYEQE